MPTWRKLALVGEMNRVVQDLALAGLRQRYPNDTPAQRRRRLASLLLGAELAAQDKRTTRRKRRRRRPNKR